MDTLTGYIQTLDSLVWQPFAMPLVLVIAGGIVTIVTGFVQVRQFPSAVRMAIAGALHRTASGEGTITPFQALSTALASTVGNGNIGGVATAILVGGPGAIAWMWICAAVGMATKYAEAVLGVHYRVTRESGELASGPMYYITRGIPLPWLARPLGFAFAFFGAAAAMLGTGNMAQSNTVARTFVEASRGLGYEVSAWVPGLLITVSVGLVLLGGIRRIAVVAERLVPSMIVLYFANRARLSRREHRGGPGGLCADRQKRLEPCRRGQRLRRSVVLSSDRCRREPRRPLQRGRPGERADRPRDRQGQSPGRAGLGRRVRSVHRHHRRLLHDRVCHSHVRTVDGSGLSGLERRPHGRCVRDVGSPGLGARRAVLVLIWFLDLDRLVVLRREMRGSS